MNDNAAVIYWERAVFITLDHKRSIRTFIGFYYETSHNGVFIWLAIPKINLAKQLEQCECYIVSTIGVGFTMYRFVSLVTWIYPVLL